MPNCRSPRVSSATLISASIAAPAKPPAPPAWNTANSSNTPAPALKTSTSARPSRDSHVTSSISACFPTPAASPSPPDYSASTSAPACNLSPAPLASSNCSASLIASVFCPALTAISFSANSAGPSPHTAPAARVAFFAGCIANVTFTKLNEATIRVLTANGCEVVVPSAQLCCGALAAHAGVREIARQLARKNIAAFGRGQFDAILTNAAGCGSTLKEYDHLFSGNEPEHAAAVAFSNHMRDVTEFLAALGLVAPLKETRLRVTYQDSCHLLHGQKVREAPRQLLRAIPGIEFVELPYSDICCGSAGVYNVTQTEASLDLLKEKMDYAKATRAATLVTANPGCLLQLRAGAEIHKTGQNVVHVVELLGSALKQS